MNNDLSNHVSAFYELENSPSVYASNPDGVLSENLGVDLISFYTSYPADVANWIIAMANDSVLFQHEPYLDPESYGALIPVFQNALYDYANRNTLGTFFDQWDGSADYLDDVTTPSDLLQVVYTDSSGMFLKHGVDSLGLDFINHAVYTLEGLSYDHFINLYSKHGLKLADLLSNEGEGTVPELKTQHYNLSEHHLYGSSRLGIKGYWPSQLYSDWDYTNETPLIDTLLFKHKQPWYSAEYQDNINPHVTIPYQNTYSAPTIVQHLLGQKQYEVTNHLGNVMITASDKKYAIANDTDTILTYRPELPSTYDYYPFGMLMPGRYTQDSSVVCATVQQTVHIPSTATYYVDVPSMTPMPLGGTVSLQTTSSNVSIISARYAGSGAMLSVPHVGVHETNQFDFQVTQISEGAQFAAQIYEYNIDDTLLLTDMLLDRDGLYELSYTPSGSGILKLHIILLEAGDSTSIYLTQFQTSITSYTPQQVSRRICSEGDDKYRFGFNGQHKENEIAGLGNHNSALFWEYDTRLGRRWNLDPKPQISVSDYAVLSNNPIWVSDVLGDFDSKRTAINHMKKYGIEGKVKNLGDGTYDINEKSGRRFYFGASTTRKDAIVKGKKMGYMEGYYKHQEDNKEAYSKWNDINDRLEKQFKKELAIGVGAGVAISASIITSPTWAPFVLRKYGNDFKNELARNILTNHGRLDQVDFNDVIANTLSAKWGMTSKIAEKAYISAVDINAYDGYMSIFNGKKSLRNFSIDAGFNYFKLGTKGLAEPNQNVDAVNSFDVLTDQSKVLVKEISK